MNRARSALFLAVLSLPFAATAFAQMGGGAGMESNRLISFGIGGGVAVPVSDAGDAFQSGFNGQGFLRLNLGGLPFVPRVDFTFSKFDLDDAQLQTPGLTGTGQLMAGLANLQLFLIPGGPIRPYVVAGVGAYNLETEVDGVPGASTSDTRFGVNGGGGLVIRLGSLVSLYAEGRVDNVFTEEGGFIDTKQIQVVPVTFGLVF